MGTKLNWEKLKKIRVVEAQAQREKTEEPFIGVSSYRRKFASVSEWHDADKRETERQSKYWHEKQNAPSAEINPGAKVHRVNGVLISGDAYLRLMAKKEKEDAIKRQRQLKKERKRNRKKPNA